VTRRVLGAIGVLALLLASPVSALTVSGRVVKGAERAPAAAVAVSVHVARAHEELPGSTMRTDPNGAYRFNGIAEGPELEYYVSTEYEDAFYTEGPIPVQKGFGAAPELVVYDVAKDFAAVGVQDHHVIVERKDDGLHVTEILIFQNHANTAFLGVGVNHALPSGMRVGLPSSVKEFKPGMGLDEPSVRLQGRELTSVRPIPPGQRPLSFTYLVPLSGRMDLSHRLYFPTRQMTVLIDDPSLRVESTQLKSGGIRDQGGKKYAMYFGSNLPVGSEVSVRIGGAGFFSNPRVYPFMAAPFVIAGVLWFAARRGAKGVRAKHAPAGVAAPAASTHAAPAAPHAAPAAPSKNGDDLAETYLYLIAALDQGVERGDVSPESHALIRGNLKRRLEVILSDAPHAKAR